MIRHLRPLAHVSHAVQVLLKRSLALLSLLKSGSKQARMSFLFGTKPRAVQSEKINAHETSEKAIEKLQAYHELAKVESA